LATKLSDLPDGWTVAYDTETSGTHPDDPDSYVSVVSWAYRDPDGGALIRQAVPFDQGQDVLPVLRATLKKGEELDEDQLNIPFGGLPLGPKDLPLTHSKRIRKWVDEHGAKILQAPNLPPSEYGRLMRALRRMRLIGHNLKFDLLMAGNGLRGCQDKPPEEGGGLDLSPSAIADTQITQHVLDPRMGVGLKPTSVRLGLGKELGLDEGSEDAEQQAMKPWLGNKKDPRFDLVPWKVIRTYAELDAALTLLLREYQLELLSDEAYALQAHHVAREFNLMLALYGMEVRGIGYDVETSRQQVEIIDKLCAEIAAELPFKPTVHGAKKYFFGDKYEDHDTSKPTGNLGLIPYSDKITPPSKTFPQGQPQIDEEVTERLIADGAPYATEYARYAELQSAASKWYRAWADLTGRDGRLRTNHKQTSVISGRLSVSRAQLQAIPQPYIIPKGLMQVRQLFVPKPGYGLWEADVSQAEIRIATALARCQPMLDEFLAGNDSHSAACWLMFRDTFDQAGCQTMEQASQHPKWDEFRQVAKRCNLGILYGAGAKTVQAEIAKFTGIHYDLKQVRQWIDQWKQAFPQFVRFLDSAADKAAEQGWVRLVNGRERWFSAYEPTHKAANQIIQGSQAEVIKDVIVRVDREMPGSLLLTIHDSVVCEFPLATGPDQIARVAEIMVTEFEKTFSTPWKRGGQRVVVPFVADTKTFGRKPEQLEAVAA